MLVDYTGADVQVKDIREYLDLMNPGGNNPNGHQIELVLMAIKEISNA